MIVRQDMVPCLGWGTTVVTPLIVDIVAFSDGKNQKCGCLMSRRDVVDSPAWLSSPSATATSSAHIWSLKSSRPWPSVRQIRSGPMERMWLIGLRNQQRKGRDEVGMHLWSSFLWFSCFWILGPWVWYGLTHLHVATCRNMSQHVATAQVEVVYKGFQPKYDSFSAMHHATSGCLSTYRMDDVVVMVSSLNSSGWWGCLV